MGVFLDYGGVNFGSPFLLSINFFTNTFFTDSLTRPLLSTISQLQSSYVSKPFPYQVIVGASGTGRHPEIRLVTVPS
uniref:Uncharacterized protein n=1 Tax=Hyaloperonospora arabidopsidis (strain Emoy2) TaxID=559515 RepID=M4BTW6_HYAAE